jgi:hypothetical protein
LLQAKVNDSAPVWFIFDTGADRTVIDAEFAAPISARSSGHPFGVCFQLFL